MANNVKSKNDNFGSFVDQVTPEPKSVKFVSINCY